MSVSASCRSASGRRRRPVPWLRSKGDQGKLLPETLLPGTEGPDESLTMPGDGAGDHGLARRLRGGTRLQASRGPDAGGLRSEEYTSELQSLAYLVCRLLLEKKKRIRTSCCKSPEGGSSLNRVPCGTCVG